MIIDCWGRVYHSIRFPNPNIAGKEGLVAIGGNLEPKTLILAYKNGIFPWSVNPITWWSPDPRAIIEFDEFYLSKRRKRYLRNLEFEYTFDKCFERVVRECAKITEKRQETWISEEFINAYTTLYMLGYAHSIECWYRGELVGGIYGVSIGSFFAGESMFSRVANASTLALAVLINSLKISGYILFDTQVLNEHIAKLGGKEISRKEYLHRLAEAINKPAKFPEKPIIPIY